MSYRLCWKQTNSKLLSVSPKSKSMNLFFLFLFSHFNVQGLKLTIEQKPNIVEKLFIYSISFISQSHLLTLEWFNLNYILNISTEKKYNEEKQKLQNLIFLIQFFFQMRKATRMKTKMKVHLIESLIPRIPETPNPILQVQRVRLQHRQQPKTRKNDSAICCLVIDYLT